MRKLFALLAVALGVVACQKDQADFGVNVGGEQEVTINVALSAETRASSANGFDLSKLSSSDYELRYILEIYQGSNCVRDVKYSNDTSVAFPVRLVPEREYKFAVWADLVKKNANRAADADADEYYETSNGLMNIAIDVDKWAPMNEARDAFYGNAVLGENDKLASLSTIELSRPFAKVRVVATDIEDVRKFDIEPDNATVDYTVDLPTTFNAVSGVASNAVDVSAINYAMRTYSDATGQLTVFADYIFVPASGTIQFSLDVKDDNASIKVNNFSTAIPVERNKVTSIVGDVLTEGGNVSVKIENELGEKETINMVNTAESLQEIINNTQAGESANIALGGDIDLNDLLGAGILSTRAAEPTYGLLIPAGKSVVLDLQGYTISQAKTQTTAYSMIENRGTLTIKDSSANKTGKFSYADNGQGGNYVSNTIQNSGLLTIEGGIVENNSSATVAANGYPHPIDNSGTLVINGGTFTNNAHYSSMRIWCTTDDNTIVTINGGTFNGSIDFQTPSAAANKGTLTINGGTFNADTYTKCAVRLLGFGADVDEMFAYINGGDFYGDIALKNWSGSEFNSKVFVINAGTFSTLSPIAFLADGYTYTLNSNIENAQSISISGVKTLDLNGKTISGIDAETKSYGLININPDAKLTINDTKGSGKIQLTSENNRGWGAYSSVISVQRGELVLNGGTIEHLGGTDMAYGIDILTNTGAQPAKATINGGVVKTTYRAIRQFLNSTSALNELIVNGGEIYSTNGNKAIWMQNANVKANPGKLVVAATAKIGDVMVSASNATELPIELSVAKAALKEGAVVTMSGSTEFDIAENNGTYNIINAYELTEEGATIYSKGGMFWFANEVNSGANYFEGKTIKLGADIDLNNAEWTPIGSAYKDHGFMGNFDGNGKIIKNLKITALTPDADQYVYGGLFGVTEGVDKDNQNYIKNLTIENVNIDLNGHIVAAAVAYPYYTALENITVKGNVSIKGGDYTSGVLAYTRRCVDAKNISIEANAGSLIEGTQTVGGVISDIQTNGGLKANYSNFKAENLTIKGTQSVGGISGILSKQTLNGATVENVAIVCDDARKGIVSGSLGEDSTLNDVVVNNVTGADYYVGATYKAGSTHTLVVDGVVYEYLTNGQIKVDGNIIIANGVILNEAGEYIISNAAGMFWFANEVNVNKNAFNGKTVTLANDIDLKNKVWTPVGQTGATTFNGVFDGKDFTIYNLNVDSEAQTGEHYSSGLFGWVESHTAGRGHLKNVKINGATINGHHNCGALVGYITQETALVENCHVTGATVTCTKANNDADGDKAGALIGNATVATPVKDCTAANSTVSAGRDSGQVIGAGKQANVTGCSATNVAVSANGTGTGANVRNEVIGRLL